MSVSELDTFVVTHSDHMEIDRNCARTLERQIEDLRRIFCKADRKKKEFEQLDTGMFATRSWKS